MSANLRAYTQALYSFDHVVRLLPHSAWDLPSPCAGWSGRDVAGHVIAVQRWIESFARQTEPSLNPFENPGRIAGDNPAATWASVRDDVLEALAQPGTLSREVTTFRGRESIDTQLGWNVVDTVAHSWDLARTGHVDDQLDPHLIEHALTQAGTISEEMRRPPFFNGSVPTPPNPTRQQQLLCLLGRPS